MRCLVVMLLLVLVGCTQPVSPPPSSSAIGPPSSASAQPSPSGSPTCSPMGGTPRPCSSEEYQKTEEKYRLTEEAIALYRRWTKESTRLYRVGGTEKPTKEMLATTAGDFQKSALGVFRNLKAAGVRAAAGQVKAVAIGPNLDVHVDDGEVAIVACMDSRSLKFVRNGKVIRRGALFVEYVVASPVQGGLRLTSVSSGGVTKCSGS